MSENSSQSCFETVYRGRQRLWHHASYMRMAKVLLGLWMLRRYGFSGEGKKIFDYGFGAGTLFRFFPKTAFLFGVEQDPRVCQEATQALNQSGFAHVQLEPVTPGKEMDHHFLSSSYDLIILSHVLEHLSDPGPLLKKLAGCLKKDGLILGLVPIHERATNPHHLQLVDQDIVMQWARAAGVSVVQYEEGDPWLYWFQPFYTHDHGWRHGVARAISLGLGIPATLCGPRLWRFLGILMGRFTFSKPTQAAFLLHAEKDHPASIQA